MYLDLSKFFNTVNRSPYRSKLLQVLSERIADDELYHWYIDF